MVDRWVWFKFTDDLDIEQTIQTRLLGILICCQIPQKAVCCSEAGIREETLNGSRA